MNSVNSLPPIAILAVLPSLKGVAHEYADLVAHPVAGTVAELGADVAGTVSIGDRVVGIPDIGAFAERAAVKAAAVVPIPEAMDFETAASFAVAYSTSHMALGYRGGLEEGETLVVFGAAGGVGLTAVEIGKTMGAEVIACAGPRPSPGP